MTGKGEGMFRGGRIGSRRTSRLALTFLTVFVFALQSHLTQTHIHRDWAASQDAKLSGIGSQSLPQPGQIPFHDERNACALCHFGFLSGAFVAPGAIAVVLPDISAAAVPLVRDRVVVLAAVTHIWQGRAPPAV